MDQSPLAGATDVVFNAMWTHSGAPTAGTKSAIRIGQSQYAGANGPAMFIRAGCQGGNIDPMSAMAMGWVLITVAQNVLGSMPTHFFSIRDKAGGREFDFPTAARATTAEDCDHVTLRSSQNVEIHTVDLNKWTLTIKRAKLTDPFNVMNDIVKTIARNGDPAPYAGSPTARSDVGRVHDSILLEWAATAEMHRERGEDESTRYAGPPIRPVNEKSVQLGMGTIPAVHSAKAGPQDGS